MHWVRTSAFILLTACSVGTTGRNYQPAKGPAGAVMSLELSGARALTGELLAVEQSSLLVLASGQLLRVPLPLIQSGRAPKVSFSGGTLNEVLRERLRLISRYPQGVSPALEARLLEVYGQTAVQRVS